jgi:hypothetical protein
MYNQPRPSRYRLATFVLLSVASIQSAWSWSAHSILTRAALADDPATQAAVSAEELSDFLSAESAGLALVLAGIEARAEAELGAYDGLPPGLAFDPAAAGDALRESFLRALRVNPRVPLGLYRQPARGEAPGSRPVLDPARYSLVGSELAGNPMERLEPGESVSALDVLATGSDEPDYGLDVGLYTNNEGPLGAAYGFGEQPYGNPALSYGSQAPFHMAFPREDPVISLAAPFSTRSQAAYREMQFSTLARFAFESGHPYWGWRFAGWALHYSQDLGQPYHARMLPGQRTLETLALNVFGSEADKNGAMILLSNRHLVIETYAYESLKDEGGASRRGLEAALAAPGSAPAYRRGWLYDVVATGAYDDGRRLDRVIAKSFPAKYVDDPTFDFGLAKEEGTDSWEPYGGAVDEAAGARIDAALADRFQAIGAQIRAHVAYMSDPDAILAARAAAFDYRGAAYIAALLLSLGGIALIIISGARTRRRKKGNIG